MRILIILSLFLVGCSTPYWEEYHLRDTTVIYTDRANEICGNEAPACYLIKVDAIVCKKDHFAECGHELYHAAAGDFNHENELAQEPVDYTRKR